MWVQRVEDGLWRWTAPHPAWRAGAGWERDVGSVYAETSGAVALVDPLVPSVGLDRERFWRALDGDVARLGVPVVVLLTCRWHVRSAAEVRARYGARVCAPDDAGDGFAGLVDDVVGDGDEPVAGVRAYLTGMPAPEQEAMYWVCGHRALVIGDVVLGDGAGGLRLAPPDWFDDGDAERAWYRGGLQERIARVAALEPAVVLPAHGAPVREAAAAALRAALDR
jgi:glyoxylase-like metal-dependent hydrolase (beta-lactamase superfamily II)